MANIKSSYLNEKNYSSEMALFGDNVEDSVVIPDPQPSTTSTTNVSLAEQTPTRTLGRLQALVANDSLSDDMGVFSPVIDLSFVDKWADSEGFNNKDHLIIDKKPDGNKEHTKFDWKPSSTCNQDDKRGAFGSPTPTISSKSEDSALTPPEAWGGGHLHLPSRLGVSSTNASTSRDFPLSLGQTNVGSEFSSTYETSSDNNLPSSPLLAKGITGLGNIDSLKLSSRRLSTYAERISTASSFSDGTSLATGSPKIKKTGAETREEMVAAPEAGVMNGGSKQYQTDQQMVGSSSFTLELFQKTLEGRLDSLQNSVHYDMRNLNIEFLRQFHMVEMEMMKMSKVLNSVLENQSEQMKELKSLRKENQELRRRPL